MTDVSVIRTRGLTKKFGDVVAVDDLDLNVEPGEIFGFVGPNGAGKSTTIRVLLDQLRATEGSASVLGLDIQDGTLEIRRKLATSPATWRCIRN